MEDTFGFTVTKKGQQIFSKMSRFSERAQNKMKRIFDSNGDVICDQPKKNFKSNEKMMSSFSNEGSGSEGSGDDWEALIDSAVEPLENMLTETVGHCKKFKTFTKNIQKIKKAMNRAADLL